ncbi:heptosyltransferase family protein [Deferribacter desulfuricans SSM1]|uniref:Heptosyltransferase family protein n=1 Tax=Deferribacter desulfuricans (strain DSM 14783 / JCM 11476 / NBRC 101012 / SSM1) TaxID=639282 RepID=D3PDE2_DEFDS|nr:glycosyltransferase family 9 protein [Deferribacter desulfuricans]BAI80615.1 heptosyltransferase family protein [Deferribacter desulfuricans SSM1]
MKVLFVRFSSLGDIILTTGIIDLLKKQYPEIEIDFLTYEQFKDILIFKKRINNILTIKRKNGLMPYLTFIQENINNYDYIFDLHANLKTFFLKIFTQSTISKYKKGSFKRRLFVKFRLFKNQLNKHVVERYFDAVNKVFELKINSIEDLRPTLLTGIKKENYIVIHPFASKKTKEWPYFSYLIENLSKYHKVVIVGSGHLEITENSNIINLTNQTSLQELTNVIAKAKLLITTDSGPMHIGIACNTPTLAIFGSTTKEFGFYPIFENCYIVENNDIKCRPCHVHGLNKCPKKHFDCMKSITPEILLEKIKQLT